MDEAPGRSGEGQPGDPRPAPPTAASPLSARACEELADLLHEVLQDVIAARWALELLEEERLPEGAVVAAGDARRAVDQATAKLRARMNELRNTDGSSA